MVDTEEEVDIWSSAVSTRILVCCQRGVTSKVLTEYVCRLTRRSQTMRGNIISARS